MTGLIVFFSVLAVFLLELILLYAAEKYITVQRAIRRATKKALKEMNKRAFESEQELLQEAIKALNR